tara:strand:- start:4022 stop:5710 length:1689 start_codon:yes stop_codon:yes gene_type:complete
MAKEILEIEVKSNIEQAAKDTDKLGVSANKASGGFTKMGGALKGMGMILRTAGIGAIIALIAKFIQTLSKNQKVIDFFNTSMHFLTDIFSQLGNQLLELGGKVGGYFKTIFEDPVGSLKNFGQAIVNNILERIRSFLDMIAHLSTAVKELVQGNFSAAGKAAKEAGKEFVDVMTGVDNSFDKLVTSFGSFSDMFDHFQGEIKKSLDEANRITELEKRAGRAEIALQKTALQAQKNAEIQRQIRDDETLSFEERIDANKKLNDILIAQIIEEKKVQQIIIAKARAIYNQNQNEANFLALQQAKVGLLEIEERITGQLSEQKTNQVALTKEQQEAENELRVAVLEGLDLELEDLKLQYEEKLKLAEKSGIETTALTEKYEKDKTKIIEENAAAQQEIQDEADAKTLKREKNIADAKKGLAVDGLRLVAEIAGEGSKIAKGVAIAQTTMSGVEAVQNAFTTAQKSPLTALFPAYPFIQAGAAATFSALQLRKIIAGSPPSESGGGGGAGAGAGAIDTQSPAPQMLSGSFSLGQGQEPEPVKAFVVTDEMTNSQNQLANIRRRSTI